MRRLRTRRLAARPLERQATVTVVIPCFNYARYLPAAVASALDQEDVVVDVVVVDDASTDDSADVARRLATEDPRVTVLVNEQNAGPVDTFNRGLARARGEYLVRLDADDMLTPGSLRRAAALLQAVPDVGLVYGHPLHFSGADLPAPRTTSTHWLVWEGHEWLAARCADGTNVITSAEVVMRRSVVDVVGGQRQLAHTHDMEMWLRMSAHTDVGYVLGADQAWHREHPQSLSESVTGPLAMLEEIRAAFDVLFDHVGARVPGAPRLERAAAAAIARQAVAYARRTLDRGTVTDEVRALVEFATACDASLPEVRRAVTALERGRVGVLPGLAGRLRRRTATVLRERRWHRQGVYERLDLTTGPGAQRAPGHGRATVP